MKSALGAIQFHQHNYLLNTTITHAQILSCTKKEAEIYNTITKDACKINRRYKIAAGVNFTNILCATFKREDPKRKKYSQVISLFVLLGSAYIKIVLKMLVKSTPSG